MENDHVKTASDRHKREIRLVMHHLEGYYAAFYGANRLGGEIDGVAPGRRILLVTHCFLTDQPGFTDCWIGRHIVKFAGKFREVVMRPDDGQTRRRWITSDRFGSRVRRLTRTPRTYQPSVLAGHKKRARVRVR